MSGKGKKILGLICLLLASWAVGVFLAFVYYQEPFWPLTNLSVGGSDENGEDDSSITLALRTDNAQFDVGTPGTMTLSVSCLDSDAIPESVTIVDDQEQTVATVALDADGNGATTLRIGAEEEYVGTLQAVAGDVMSDKLYYYVQPEVTETMMQTLVDVAADLYAYVSDMNAEDPYSDESLEAVKEWLEADSRVGAAEIYSPYVIYITADGLAGSYGMGEYEEGYWGSSSVSEAYEALKDDKSLTDFYIDSDLTMTNSTITMLSPYVENNEVIPEPSKKSLGRFAESIDGSLRVVEGVDVIEALGNGDYLDSGFVCFMTHGSLLTKNVSSPMLYFDLGTVESGTYEELMSGKEVSGNMDAFKGSGNGDVEPEAFRLIYDVTADGLYTIQGTRNYLVDGIGNRRFDNTIIYFMVCQAASDRTLRNIFAASGAAVFIGTTAKLEMVYAGVLLEELTEVLGGNTNEIDLEDFKGIGDLTLVGSLDDEDVYKKYFYQLLADGEGTTYEEIYSEREIPQITTRDNTFNIMQQIVNEELETISSEKISIETMAHRAYRNIASSESGEIARFYSLRGDDFSMSGGGTMSGHVEDTSGNPLAGAQVTLYRWLNHHFTEVAEAVTDEDGVYTCEGIPFGLYAIEASCNGQSAYTTMELTIQDREADPIIIDDNVYCTLTSEDGTVQLGSLSVKVITQLEDGNRTILEQDGAKLVEAEGRFLICNAWEAVSCQVDVYYGTTLLKRYSINEINPDTQDVTLDLSLAYLDVIVNDDSGNFLSSASVSISGKEGDSGAGGVAQSAVLGTNESGQSVYRLPVTPGTYYISVTAGDDELAQNDEVVVQGNTTVTYPKSGSQVTVYANYQHFTDEMPEREIAFPVVTIEGNETAAWKINADQGIQSNKYVNGYSDYGYIELYLDDAAVTGQGLSMMMHSYRWMSAGAWYYNSNCRTYDLKSGEVLQLNDILAEGENGDTDNAREALAALMTEQFSASEWAQSSLEYLSYKYSSAEEIIRGEFLEADEDRRERQWYLNEEGLHVLFDGGQVDNKVSGIVQFTVPWEQLTDVIKSEYQPEEVTAQTWGTPELCRVGEASKIEVDEASMNLYGIKEQSCWIGYTQEQAYEVKIEDGYSRMVFYANVMTPNDVVCLQDAEIEEVDSDLGATVSCLTASGVRQKLGFGDEQ